MATEYYEYRKNKFVRRSMQRIRQSFRESFRRSGSKDRGLSAAAKSTDPKPQQWHQDEATVRAGTCNFFVKYLGCVEVFESRGMQVCEEALKVLRAQRRRPVKAVLYTSGDGLRVVDAENKGLIVDQTIEKVSFCAPDRDHVKGFAYICRDGTTRRWMCHGFHAVKESGERLSHAVGCAFAVCLEKKQKRDRDAQTQSQLATLASSSSHALASSASVDSTPVHANGGTDNAGGVTNDTFTRAGSIRQASLVERLADPQQAKPAQPVPVKESGPLPSAVARPAANPDLFQRNGSLRMPTQRHQSLRMGDLPSTLQRQGQMGIPGARVSAIPEEGGLGIDLAALYATPQKGKLVHADTVTGLPPWDSAAHSQGGSVTSDSSNPSTSRSRAEAWLESTLQSARPGSLSPPNGASSPPPGTPPSLPAAVSPGVLGSDIFGQPAFAPAVPPRPPKLTKANTVDDPFEAKWAQLAKQPSPPPPTNPFRTHSTAVQL